MDPLAAADPVQAEGNLQSGFRGHDEAEDGDGSVEYQSQQHQQRQSEAPQGENVNQHGNPHIAASPENAHNAGGGKGVERGRDGVADHHGHAERR